MVFVCGIVTGLKKGKTREDGKRFDTLRVEANGKQYFPMFDSEVLPNVSNEQEITLACNVKVSKRGYLDLFVVAHVADSLILDPMDYSGNGSNFNDFDSF